MIFNTFHIVEGEAEEEIWTFSKISRISYIIFSCDQVARTAVYLIWQ